MTFQEYDDRQAPPHRFPLLQHGYPRKAGADEWMTGRST